MAYVYKCRLSTQPHKIYLGADMDGSVHNRTNLAKVTPVPKVGTPIQYTTAQDMFWVSGGQYTDSVHNRTRYVLGVDMDGSVHNRTSLEKVTQAYFSQEKRASPWGSPEVSTPIQYTTAQDMFGCRHGRFSTQPQ